MDDDELMAAMAGGDDTALRELFSRHAPWMAARLRAVLPAADVEDVLQETFLGAWRGAGGYRGEGAGGWLWGIARRQAAMWLRRRGRPDLPAAEPPGGLPGGPPGGPPGGRGRSGLAPEEVPQPDPVDAALDRLALADAVAALGPQGSPHRETWRLMYEEDRTVAEVAALMGVPPGTVKSRAHQIRRLLRRTLGGGDGR